MIQKVLNLMTSSIGKIIISCIWGFALALIFQKTCADGRCIVINGPRIDEVNNKIHNFGNQDGCYRFQAYPIKCVSRNTPV